MYVTDKSAWLKLVRRFGSPSKPRTFAEEWLSNSPDRSQIEGSFGATPHTWALVTSKQGIARWWRSSFPEDAALWGIPWTMHPDVRSWVRSMVRRLKGKVVFVSDLDPPSLVRYIALRYGTVKDDRPIHGIKFGGVDDSWLAIAEGNLRQRHHFEVIQISFQRGEKALFDDLETAVDLERLVGPRSLSILRNRMRIEQDGACNPQLYRPRFHEKLFQHFRSRAEGENHQSEPPAG